MCRFNKGDNMKTTLNFGMAAFFVIYANCANAQSNITIYGIADIGIEYQKIGAGSKGPTSRNTVVASGSGAANRLGFRGTEDLGAGSKAFFVLEAGFNVDDGTMVSNGFQFNRRSIIGLSGGWGELSLGRDYSPGFWVLAGTDLNKAGLYSGPGTTTQITQLFNTRQSNGLYYITPDLNGFKGRLTWTAGEERNTAPRDAGRLIGASVQYSSEKFSAGLFYQETRVAYPANSSKSDKNTYAGLSATYNFGAMSLNGGVYQYNPAGPNKSMASAVLSVPSGKMTGSWLTLMIPFNSSEVRINLGHINTTLQGVKNGKAMLYGVNYIHNLSKSTSIYAGIGKINNNSNSAINAEAGQRTVNGNGLGSDSLMTTVGIRKNF